MKTTIKTTDNKNNTLVIEVHNDQYFSITGTIYEAKKPLIDKYVISCGCIHKEILEVRPDLKLLVDLHLSDLNGVPMYAAANGFYFYQIVIGEALYHTPEPTDKEKYTKVLSEHLRIDLNAANLLINWLGTFPRTQRKDYFAKYVTEQFSRWQSEALEANKLIESLNN